MKRLRSPLGHLHIAAGVGGVGGGVFTEYKQSDGEEITEGKSSTGGRIKGKRKRKRKRNGWEEDEEK